MVSVENIGWDNHQCAVVLRAINFVNHSVSGRFRAVVAFPLYACRNQGHPGSLAKFSSLDKPKNWRARISVRTGHALNSRARDRMPAGK
jgi:hypothetical protein